MRAYVRTERATYKQQHTSDAYCHSTNMTTPPLNFTISPIPRPPSPEVLQSYKHLRLTALKTDPSAFGSTYERERVFSDETWLSRIAKPGLSALVARGPDGTFAGSVTAVAVRAVPEVALPDGATLGRTRSYFIFGMWIRPEHRRKGLGRRLVEAALRWIREDADGQGRGKEPVEIWVAVTAGNDVAKGLYEGSGFEEVEREEDGKNWLRNSGSLYN